MLESDSWAVQKMKITSTEVITTVTARMPSVSDSTRMDDPDPNSQSRDPLRPPSILLRHMTPRYTLHPEAFLAKWVQWI